MHEQTDRRTARRDCLQTTCDCAYRQAAHCRRRLIWSTPVINGAEWLICMREATPTQPKHTGTACRCVVWLWLDPENRNFGDRAAKCDSFRKRPHSFLQSRAEPSCSGCISLFCSILFHHCSSCARGHGVKGSLWSFSAVWGSGGGAIYWTVAASSH